MPFNIETMPESVKNITIEEKWTDFQTNLFLSCANAAIDNGDDEAKATEEAVLQVRQLANSERNPEIFYCRHMEPGVANYGAMKYLVNADTMKRMMPSFSARPVLLQHMPVNETEKVRNSAGGYVVETFYNELDGWLWSKFLATGEDVHWAIQNGYSVSNAYVPTKFGPGGKHIGIDFDKEILDAEFQHLALVRNPRYKGSRIFTADGFKQYQAQKKKELEQLQNSEDEIKNKGAKKMPIKFFNKAKTEVTKADDLNEDTVIQLSNNDEISLGDMIKTVTDKKEADKKAAEQAQLVNDDTIVEVGGEKMTLKALKEKYEAIQLANEGEEEEAEKAAEEEVKKEETEKAEKKKEEEQLANSANFQKMKKAGNGAQEEGRKVVSTSFSMIAEGKKRYGKK